jgi:gliding motility-associated-like protein
MKIGYLTIKQSFQRVLLITFLTLASQFAFGQSVCDDLEIIGPDEACVVRDINNPTAQPKTNNVSFSVKNNSGSAIISYNWSGGTSTGILATYTPDFTVGTYTVTVVVVVNGVTCTLSKQFIANDLPEAIITPPSPTTQCFDGNPWGLNTFNFKSASRPGSSNSPIRSYEWVFGDGQTDTGADLNHTYQAPGAYNVTLTVTDANGCSDVQSIPLTIKVLEDINPNFSLSGTSGCDSSTFNLNYLGDTTGTYASTFRIQWGETDANGNPNPGTTINGSTPADWQRLLTGGYKYTYKEDGCFPVTLTINNKLNCSKSRTISDQACNVTNVVQLEHDDSVCYDGNNVQFKAKPIENALFWAWDFGDPDSGPQNTALFDWQPSHEYVGGPKNYEVRLTVITPCGQIDTCFVVKLKGPAAAITLPPPPPNNFYTRVPRFNNLDVFRDMNAGKFRCDWDTIQYEFVRFDGQGIETRTRYCNADTISKVTNIQPFCNGDTLTFTESLVLDGEDYQVFVPQFTQIARTFTKGDPTGVGSQVYQDSADGWNNILYHTTSGGLVFQKIHDSDLNDENIKNFVRFTNNTTKYRLDQLNVDDAAPSLSLDTCKTRNFNASADSCRQNFYEINRIYGYHKTPFNDSIAYEMHRYARESNWASDSLLYLWSFGDPEGLPCTSTYCNPDPRCNFSTMIAPYHHYDYDFVTETRCISVQLTVNDTITGCESRSTQILRYGKPEAGWDEVQTLEADVFDRVEINGTDTTIITKKVNILDFYGYEYLNWYSQSVLPTFNGDPRSRIPDMVDAGFVIDRTTVPNQTVFDYLISQGGRVLPLPQDVPQLPRPRRGFQMRGSAPCATPQNRFQMVLDELLPTGCGLQEYWIVFDSAAATTVDRVCPNGDTIWNYGFLGSTNDKGHQVGAPNSVWTNIPWGGFYWYLEGDEGCKTVGVVVRNGYAYDTAWYHDYICFDRFTSDFEVLDLDKGPLNQLVGDSRNQGIGFNCLSGDTINPGFTLGLRTIDTGLKLITTFDFDVRRREFPAGDFYYTPNFWIDTPSTQVLPTFFDSISARDARIIYVEDSNVQFILESGDSIFIERGLTFLYDYEIDSLNVRGRVTIPAEDLRNRYMNTSINPRPITLVKYNKPDGSNSTGVQIGRQIAMLNVNPQRPSKIPTKNDCTLEPGENTVKFNITEPGFYTINSSVENINGCFSGSSFQLIYGHFAKFTASDSVICVGTEVTFTPKVRYWTTNCLPVFGRPVDGCLMEAGRSPDNIVPWDGPLNHQPPTQISFADQTRLANNPGWVNPTLLREQMRWDFNGDGRIDVINPDPANIKYTYNTPGIFDVTMLTRDSNGCVVRTRRNNFIKVIDLRTDINLIDTNRKICAPQFFTYADSTTMLGSDSNVIGKFYSKEQVPAFDGTLVRDTVQEFNFQTNRCEEIVKLVPKGFYMKDTFILVDEIVNYIWDPGNGDGKITRTTNTPPFTAQYRENGFFDVSLSVRTKFLCPDSVTKTNFFEIDGPQGKYSVSALEGCLPHIAVIKTKSFKDVSSITYTAVNRRTGADAGVITARQDTLEEQIIINDTGEYYIRMRLGGIVSDPTGQPCVYSFIDSTFIVKVYGPDSAQAVGPREICPNQVVSYNALDTNNNNRVPKPTTTIDWFAINVNSFDTVAVGQGNRFTFSSPDTGFLDIILRTTTENTCVSEEVTRVYVVPIIADFEIDSSEAAIARFTFTNTTKLANENSKATYIWTFGDESADVDRDEKTKETHIYDNLESPNPGAEEENLVNEYQVRLIARTENGCPDTAIKTIYLRRDWKRYNIFTPNGDGVNDKFSLKIDGELEYDLVIYNRWGDKMFESTSKANEWDGTNLSGTECAEGYYYYIWKFKLIGGVEKTTSGMVYLQRE